MHAPFLTAQDLDILLSFMPEYVPFASPPNPMPVYTKQRHCILCLTRSIKRHMIEMHPFFSKAHLHFLTLEVNASSCLLKMLPFNCLHRRIKTSRLASSLSQSKNYPTPKTLGEKLSEQSNADLDVRPRPRCISTHLDPIRAALVSRNSSQN